MFVCVCVCECISVGFISCCNRVQNYYKLEYRTRFSRRRPCRQCVSEWRVCCATSTENNADVDWSKRGPCYGVQHCIGYADLMQRCSCEQTFSHTLAQADLRPPSYSRFSHCVPLLEMFDFSFVLGFVMLYIVFVVEHFCTQIIHAQGKTERWASKNDCDCAVPVRRDDARALLCC